MTEQATHKACANCGKDIAASTAVFSRDGRAYPLCDRCGGREEMMLIGLADLRRFAEEPPPDMSRRAEEPPQEWAARTGPVREA